MIDSYAPLRGVKVLDRGMSVPAALTSGKLAALGADVVKVEQLDHRFRSDRAMGEAAVPR